MAPLRITVPLAVALATGLALAPAASAAPCGESVRLRLGETLRSRAADAVAVPPWSLEQGDLRLTLEQLFPAGYLAELRAAGEVKLVVGKPDLFSGEGVRVSVEMPGRGAPSAPDPWSNPGANPWVNDTTFVDFLILRHPRRPGAVIIEGLSAHDPLAPAPTGAAAPPPGLPGDVFRHFRDQLFVAIRASGATEVVSQAQSTYVVTRLYRSTIGMKPADPRSAAHFAQLDEWYRYATRDAGFPAEVRPRAREGSDVARYGSVPEQFQRLLATGRLEPEHAGVIGSSPWGSWNGHADRWDAYARAGGDPPPGMRVHRDSAGKPRLVQFRDGDPPATTTYFISHLDSPPRLFSWYDESGLGKSELSVPANRY